jgi:hypothetical protein
MPGAYGSPKSAGAPSSQPLPSSTSRAARRRWERAGVPAPTSEAGRRTTQAPTRVIKLQPKQIGRCPARKCRTAFTRDAGKEMRMTKLLESATPHNQSHTAICPVCGDRFARGRHSNRHKAAGRKTVAWSTYCSRACRQAAYRIRKDIHNNVPASARRRRPAKRRLPPLCACVTSAPERLPSSYPHTSVTWPEISQRFQGPATPKKKTLPRDIAPDGKWPGMYRLRLPNGQLSDMLNLIRAKDAVKASGGTP